MLHSKFKGSERLLVLTYSAGEIQITIPEPTIRDVEESCIFDARILGECYCNATAIAQVADVLAHSIDISKIGLFMPYMPYSRQDRRVAPNTASSLKVFAGQINAMGFGYVKTIDPHSDVCEAVFDSLKILSNESLVAHALRAFRLDDVTFLAPDAGAAKKLPALTNALDLESYDIATASKHRDVMTGDITHTSVPDGLRNNVVIVDDICDGGRTFIEIAKALPGETKKHLIITHGIFSKGLDVIFEHFDTVTTTNSFQQLPDDRLNVVGI